MNERVYFYFLVSLLGSGCATPWTSTQNRFNLSKSFIQTYGDPGSKTVLHPKSANVAIAIGTTTVPSPFHYFYINGDGNNPIQLAIQNRNMGNRGMAQLRAMNGLGGISLGVTGGFQDSSDLTVNTGFVATDSTIQGGLYVRTNAEGAPLRFGTFGREVARFDSDGNLGLGTTTPTEKLEVRGRIKAHRGIVSLGTLGLGSPSRLVSDNDTLRPHQSYHLVDAALPNQIYSTISTDLFKEGDVLVLRLFNVRRPITLKKGLGNLALKADFVLNREEKTITLLCIGKKWVELSRTDP